MNTKGPSTYTSNYLKAAQTNEVEEIENLHTKVQCQKQQLQHILQEKNKDDTGPTDYCPPVWDEFLCWPRTRSGEEVTLPCPLGVKGLDPKKSVARQCLEDGTWFSCSLNKNSSRVESYDTSFNDKEVVGWTNYSHCWSSTTAKLMKELNFTPTCPTNDDETDNSYEIKLYIANMSRVLEMIGYSVSFVVLIFALITFCYFRKLRKPYVTRIHMNLFASILLQCFIRLVIYGDQMIVRKKRHTQSQETIYFEPSTSITPSSFVSNSTKTMTLNNSLVRSSVEIALNHLINSSSSYFNEDVNRNYIKAFADHTYTEQPEEFDATTFPMNATFSTIARAQEKDHIQEDLIWGIDNTPILCQTFYTLIEYGKTTMFLWMFIEGIILYHMTTVAYSRGPENKISFYFCGWLLPVPLTIVWLITKAYESDVELTSCGSGYSFLSSYWILEGPRLAVILLNVLVICNVMYVLFTNMLGNETIDTKQIRKSLKSLFFLLPLLGVTNILHHLWPNPLRGPWPSFALWSFTTHFLYSFQGVFVASVYFLFDKKVIDVLKNYWRNDILHQTERNETAGRVCSVYVSPTRNYDNNITEIRTGAGSRGWKTTAHGKGSLSKPKCTPPDRNRTNSAASISNVRFFETENELQGELISIRRSSKASNCIPKRLSSSSAASLNPNSPHISTMNRNHRKGSKNSNDSEGNKTSFKNNNSKRNVRIRVISSCSSESRPSWYKSMKMRRFSTSKESTHVKSKSSLGEDLIRPISKSIKFKTNKEIIPKNNGPTNIHRNSYNEKFGPTPLVIITSDTQNEE